MCLDMFKTKMKLHALRQTGELSRVYLALPTSGLDRLRQPCDPERDKTAKDERMNEICAVPCQKLFAEI